MKKIFSLFTAALLSVSMFASVDVAPSDAVLADYYETGQLCVCVYFQGEVCSDIVWAGTYNSWDTSDPTTMAKFEPVENYDGWYVVAVTDSTDQAVEPGICGKPVQLKNDGSFDWAYQTGDAASWTLIRGSVNINAGYAGEANMEGWSTAQPNVLISAYWKNQGSPCVTVPTHNYKISLKAPMCEGPDGFYAPAIIGKFNEWSEGVAMELNEGTLAYEYTIANAEEKWEFKFKAMGDTDWSNQIQMKDTTTDEWKDMNNIALPVCSADTTLEFDFSDAEMYKYTKCGAEEPDTLESVTVTLVAPAFCEAIAVYADSVQIIGGFDGWSGTMMTKGADNTYTVTLNKIVTGTEYKFRAGTTWDVEPVDAEGQGIANIKFQKGETEITKDLSDLYWKGCPTAIEEIVAAAEVAGAQKMMVDGKMYIVVNGAIYDVMGAIVK